jgi:protein-L-isoaspartate(D-aspartate) O-methyltransferase
MSFTHTPVRTPPLPAVRCAPFTAKLGGCLALLTLLALLGPGACQPSPRNETTAQRPAGAGPDGRGPMTSRQISSRDSAGSPSPDDSYVKERADMVAHQLRGRDITDAAVLAVMGRVPRHEFVPKEYWHVAYGDGPLPIGHNQTISQPYIVALMTQLARPRPDARALDIGTGSGYQAAVLSELVREVYGIEIICPLADSAAARLTRLGYDNVTVRCGDGYRGWPEHAPFDLIILAAAPDHVPQPLIDQLAPGGRLVLPVGDYFQELVVVEKLDDGSVKQHGSIPVRFVPMTGETERHKPD